MKMIRFLSSSDPMKLQKILSKNTCVVVERLGGKSSRFIDVMMEQ